MERIKMHPVYIFYGIKQYIFLLAIPLLRGLIYYLVSSNIYLWFKGSWIDISIFMMIIGLSVVKWNNYDIYFDEDKIEIVSRYLVTKRTIINRKDVSRVTLLEPFYLRFFKATKLDFSTIGGDEIPGNIIVSKRKLLVLKLSFDEKSLTDKNKLNNISLKTTVSTAFLSLVLSDSLAGVILMSTFISTASKILLDGEKLRHQLHGSFTEITRRLAFGFSPVGVAITYILIGGWVIAFIRNLILYINFNLKKDDKKIKITSGIINLKTEYIGQGDISHIDIIQNIFMKAISLCSVLLQTKSERGGQSVAITSISKKILDKNINSLFDKNIKNLKTMDLRPELRSILGYVYIPVVIYCVILASTSLLISKFSRWTDFLMFINLISGVICGWLFIIKVMDLKTGGLSYQDDSFIIKYSRRFKFHTVIIPETSVIKIKTTQTIIQKYFGKCNIYIFAFSGTSRPHVVKSINISTFEKFFNNINGNYKTNML